MLVGCYVGFATVGIFVAWYLYPSVLGLDLSHDGHTPVTYSQLSDWEECPTWTGFQVSTRACTRELMFIFARGQRAFADIGNFAAFSLASSSVSHFSYLVLG